MSYQRNLSGCQTITPLDERAYELYLTGCSILKPLAWFAGKIGMKNYDYLKSHIREIPDFPTPGVSFKDITPLLEDPKAFRDAINGLTRFLKNEQIDKVVGIDARGFLLAAPVAYVLKSGLVIVRKKGKLPSEIIREYHELEYGRASMEIHTDSIQKGERVVIIDDVLATGGTAGAAVRLARELNANVVGIGFLIELTEFPGREKLGDYPIFSLLTY